MEPLWICFRFVPLVYFSWGCDVVLKSPVFILIEDRVWFLFIFGSFWISDGGCVFTCGDGSFGQLGHGDYRTHCSPVRVSYFVNKHVEQIACGMRHSLVLLKGNCMFNLVYCCFNGLCCICLPLFFKFSPKGRGKVRFELMISATRGMVSGWLCCTLGVRLCCVCHCDLLKEIFCCYKMKHMSFKQQRNQRFMTGKDACSLKVSMLWWFSWTRVW